MPASRSERLDPELRAYLEKSDAEGAPPIETLHATEARALRNPRMKAHAGEPVRLAWVEDLSIPGPDGEIPLRIYAEGTEGLRPGLIYFHGGGFVVGNLDTHDSVCRALAAESGALVLAIDYRLAPEHQCPAAVEDAYAATCWIAAHAVQLGIDPACISIDGDSAGGNLATVVAHRLRGAVPAVLRSQILIYPVMDVSSFATDSYRELGEGYGLTRAAMQWFAGQYVRSPADAAHPEASPIYAADLRGLPAALVITAEFDPLRDEGEAYAARLREAGVRVTLSRYDGMIHGFVAMRGVASGGRRAISEVAVFIRNAVR